MSQQEKLPLTYEIRTVADFAALPQEKQGACLIDFAAWLDLVHGARVLAQQGGLKVLPPDADVFRWIDDGKHVATVTLSHEGVELAQESYEFAPPEGA